MCGSVTGGILVLGLRHGRGENDDSADMEFTYAKTRELMDRFAAKHGTCICRQLLNGCDLMSEEGRNFFKKNELREKTCRPTVETVVEILESMS